MTPLHPSPLPAQMIESGKGLDADKLRHVTTSYETLNYDSPTAMAKDIMAMTFKVRIVVPIRISFLQALPSSRVHAIIGFRGTLSRVITLTLCRAAPHFPHMAGSAILHERDAR
jgi:hypothetical protein